MVYHGALSKVVVSSACTFITVYLFSCFPSVYSITGSYRSICMLEFLHPTSEAAGSNLEPGASCWKIGSYLPMSGRLQCSMHWFPPPVKLPVAI